MKKTLIIAVSLILGAAALGALGLAGCRPVRRFFLPPQVELRERYERRAGGPAFDHGAFDRLLAAHVTEAGLVDYDGFDADAVALGDYLQALAQAPFAELDRDEKLALLLNAYNAFTIRLILDHRPLTSIRDIPENERWTARRWRVAGETTSLEELEHEWLRPRFREPRIHFALNCASIGCPPLRREAWVASRLETQLEAQAKRIHGDRRWFRFEPRSGTAHLTALYDWYAGDFAQVAGSPLRYAARYSPALTKILEEGGDVAVEWLPYDWSLNAAP